MGRIIGAVIGGIGAAGIVLKFYKGAEGNMYLSGLSLILAVVGAIIYFSNPRG